MRKEKLMTTGEVASYLSCSRSTVRRLVARGQMPHYRLGRLVRFRRGELEAWLSGYHGGLEPAGVTGPPSDPDQLSLFGWSPLPG